MTSYQRWKNIMKAYPFEEKRLSKWKPPFIVQPKYDGVRCRAVPTENGILLLSSEENVIFSVPHINEELKSLGLKAELDGELYIHGASFEEIVSITSRTVNISSDHQKIQYHVFDIVNEESQIQRLLTINKLAGLKPSLKIAPFWLCESLDEIMKTYDFLLREKYEGIIVRTLFNQYERKRSTQVMKFKPKKSDSYEIIDFEEEISVSGTPKDSLGALVLSSGDGSTFKVGTGFSAEQRHDLWRSRDDLKGKVALINYQHLTDRKVPRFPVFVEVIDGKETCVQ